MSEENKSPSFFHRRFGKSKKSKLAKNTKDAATPRPQDLAPLSDAGLPDADHPQSLLNVTISDPIVKSGRVISLFLLSNMSTLTCVVLVESSIC